MWLLFVPILVLAVVAFMLVATLFAGVFWVVGAGWPWLLIGLGAWLFWHEDGRHHRRRGWRHRAQPVAQSQSQARKKADEPAPPRPRPLRQTELPIDVQVKVEQIRRKVDVLLGYADRFPPFSQDLYLVRETASDYLPRTINAFMALPKDTADKPLSADGKTAHQELKAQLDLLDSKLDDIAQDLQRQDADRLLANRRFLESRFGLRNKTEVA
jgi:ABC-type nickel/cobalt efflux system permease component RcnA